MRIRCESCNKIYDYNQTETCPNCGAFNVNRQGSGAIPSAAYRLEKQQEERARRIHTQREHTRTTDADCRWEQQTQAAQGAWRQKAGEAVRKNPRGMVKSIFWFIVILNVFSPILGLLFTNIASDSGAEEVDTYIYEDALIMGEDDTQIDHYQVTDSECTVVPMYNMEAEIYTPWTIDGESFGLTEDDFWLTDGVQEGETGNILMVPYTCTVTEEVDLEQENPVFVEYYLELDIDGETNVYYSTWEEEILEQLEETNCPVSYFDAIIYEDTGTSEQAYLPFLVPSEAETGRLVVEVKQFTNWEEDYEDAQTELLERHEIEFTVS